MGTEQIIHIERSQAVSLTLLTIVIELGCHLVLCPLYLVGIGKEEVDVLNGRTASGPSISRVVVGCPSTRGYLTPAVGGIIAHRIIGSHLREWVAAVRKTGVSITQYTFSIAWVIVHILHTQIVLNGWFEEVVAAHECHREGKSR